MNEEPAMPPELVLYCHVVIDDASGEVLECSRFTLDAGMDLVLPPLPPGQTRLAVSVEDYERVRTGRPHRLEGNELVAFTRVTPIEELKAHALAQIDADAERARLRFISPGAGQSLEYQATEREAREFLDAPTLDLTAFPFLEAEVDAIHDATGVRPDPAGVAQTVVNQAEAWRYVGSTIKRLRRTGKMAVEAATTKAEIQAALNIPWPQPSTV